MKDQMRVLFDGFWWYSGPLANRTVQRELVHAWADAYPEDTVFLAVRGEEARDLPAGVTAVRTHLWPHGLSNATELALLGRRLGVHTVVAHNFAPQLGHGTVFVHDAMFVDHPEWFSRKERAYFSAMLPLARRAAVVATSSQVEALRLERLSPALRPVVPTGLAPPTPLVAATPRRPASIREVDGFALAVGRLNIRKNLEAAIAGARASARVSPQSPLVVVGSAEHSGVDPDLPPDITNLVNSGEVLFAGRLDDDELAWLYSHASVVVSLSRDEGFGLTPVEAATFSRPLVVSDIPVHRETVGRYATFVPLDCPAERIGHALDAAWDSFPTAEQVLGVVSTWRWASAAARLREAILTNLGT